MTTLPQR